MIRILIISSLFLGCWSTAMAGSYTATIDTAIFIHESGFGKLVERTDTHVECTVDFERVMEDTIILKIYDLHGEWGKESNLLPSSKALISSSGHSSSWYRVTRVPRADGES